MQRAGIISSLIFLSYSLGSGKRGLVVIKFTSPVISGGEPTWLGCVTKSMNLVLLTCLCSTWAVCAQSTMLLCFKSGYPGLGQNIWSQLETQRCIPVQKCALWLTLEDFSHVKTGSMWYRKEQSFVASFSPNLYAHTYFGCIASAFVQEIILPVI